MTEMSSIGHAQENAYVVPGLQQDAQYPFIKSAFLGSFVTHIRLAKKSDKKIVDGESRTHE